MLVIVSITALIAGLPLDLVSLFLTLVQTLATIFTFVNTEEDNEMAYRLMVGSGTHGVVLNL